jgi:ABC-type glycerol-3-phosphate transport system permease component
MRGRGLVLARFGLLAGLGISAVYPFLYMLNIAFKTRAGYLESGYTLSIPPDFGEIGRAAEFAFLPGAYVTTGGVIAVTVVALWIIGGLAAYGVVFQMGRTGALLLILILLGMMIPIQTIIQPFFVLMARLGLVDQYYGLVLAFVVFYLPVTTFQLVAHFRGLPKEVIDAARVDGASPTRVLLSVVVPMARPAFAATGILNAIWLASDFLLPVILMQRPERQMLVVRLALIRQRIEVSPPQEAAAALLVIAPIVAFYLLAQRQLVRGVTAGIGK